MADPKIDVFFTGAAVILREHGFGVLADEITTMWSASRATVNGQATRIMELEAEREGLYRKLNPPDAAAPSPAVDRETLVEVLGRDHAEINALWDEDPDDYWRTLADRLIAAGYICTPGHEWQCPGCGATTRARMADYPTEAEHVCPAVRAVVVDREALLDVLKLADADYSHGYRTTAYLTHIADALLARYDIRERGETA